MSDNIPLTTGFGKALKWGAIGIVGTIVATAVAGIAVGSVGAGIGWLAAGSVGATVGAGTGAFTAAAVRVAGTIGTAVAVGNAVLEKRDEYKQVHSQIETSGVQFEGRTQGAPVLPTGRNGG